MLISELENDPQSLRGFLGLVARTYPDELLRIDQPVSSRLETTAMIFELERAGKNPVVIFGNVEGHTMPDGRFVAESVQAKCASKYEAKPQMKKDASRASI